jgi:homoserine kinase
MTTSPTVRAYAPATVANLGPGFDVMGLAVAFPGDVVEAWLDSAIVGVEMVEITGDEGLLPRDASQNTAGVAAIHVLAAAGWSGHGVALRLEKGLPLGSGLGSSAASAAAAATAVNRLLGDPLSDEELLEACRQAEAVACGTAHADNVAPALAGGIVLIPPGPSVRAVSLPVPADLWCALVHPDITVRTEDARAVLPQVVPMGDAIANVGRVALFVNALHTGRLEDLAEATQCALVTPYRQQLIPGYDAFIEAARIAGAVATGIAGSGPTLFGFACGEAGAERVASAWESVLHAEGMSGDAWAVPIDAAGARVLAPGESP